MLNIFKQYSNRLNIKNLKNTELKKDPVLTTTLSLSISAVAPKLTVNS